MYLMMIFYHIYSMIVFHRKFVSMKIYSAVMVLVLKQPTLSC